MSSPVSFRVPSFNQVPSIMPHIDRPIIYKRVAIQETLLPCTQNIKIQETNLLSFATLEVLKETLTHPTTIDEETIEKCMMKLSPIVGQKIYPSQLAKLLVELAFIDTEPMRLTPKQRTENMPYLLSNLGCNESEIIKELYAFYYSYSAENFASARN